MKIANGEIIEASRNGFRQMTVKLNGGTAKIEALTEDEDPVPVPDGDPLVEGIITFYAVSGQRFIITLTGAAEAWIAG